MDWNTNPVDWLLEEDASWTAVQRHICAADYPVPPLREEYSKVHSAAEYVVPVPVVDYREFLKIRKADLTRFESLLAQPLSSNRYILSRQRSELLDAYDHTLATLANGWIPGLDDDPLIEPTGPCYWETESDTLYSGTSNCEIASGTHEPSPPQLKLVWVLVAAEFLRQLARRLDSKTKQATKLLYALIVRTFCGVSWERRAWFLRHGSHPPKPEHGLSVDPSFGCA